MEFLLRSSHFYYIQKEGYLPHNAILNCSSMSNPKTLKKTFYVEMNHYHIDRKTQNTIR